MTSSTLGSQRLLQNAINRRPELVEAALRKGGALTHRESVAWKSPVASEKFKEYRDNECLNRIGVSERLRSPLRDFWPARGAVWDALGIVEGKIPLLLEAKAHIPEAASPRTKASPGSLILIEKSLKSARRYFAPKSKASWTGVFYQYANRLAYQYYLREVNKIESRLVFLYFTNATDMEGPTTEEEWHGAARLIHAVLGLPADLTRFGVHKAFIDARDLAGAA